MLRNTNKERLKSSNSSMLYGVLFGAIVATSLPTSANAQTLKAYEKAANKAYIEKDFYNAAQYYQIVLASKKKTALYYKYAEASRFTYSYEAAAEAYKQVLADPKEKANYPLAEFEYANCLKHLARYDEAHQAYSNFIQSYYNNDFIKQKAQQELQACIVSKNLVNTPHKNVVVEALGKQINSEYSDFAPSVNNGIFFFSSLKYKQEETISPSPKKKKTVTKTTNKLVSKVLMQESDLEPVLLESLNNSDKHTANISWSNDGTIAFFTVCETMDNNDIQCQIWQAKWDKEKHTFTEVKALPEAINMPNYNNTHPHVAYMADTKQTLLLFTTDRPGGQGKMDIWAAEWKENNTFGIPFNLGRTVNTPDDEATPYYHAATQYLYFSSNWHYGLGGFDVFKSKRIANTVWQNPQNLGLPYNSAANDLYFIPTDETTNNGYLASNRTGSMTLAGQGCCNDIYKFTVTPTEENPLLVNNTTNQENIIQESTVSTKTTPVEEPKTIAQVEPKTTPVVQEPKTIAQVEPKTTPVVEEPKAIAQVEPKTTPVVEEPKTIAQVEPKTTPVVEEPKTIAQVEPKTTPIVEKPKTIAQVEPKTTPIVEEPKTIASTENRSLPTPPQPVQKTTASTTVVDTNIVRQEVLEQKLQELNKMLPLTLYFHNDEPDSNTVATSTDKPYELPYQDYIAMQSLYEKEHAGQFNAEVRQATLKKISDFFEFDLKGEYNRMNFFFEKVLELLDNGATLDLTIKGYTSPRSTERYNHALAQRRIASVRKQLFIYKNGVFLKYFQAGKLSVNNLPLGETTAPKFISDRIDDPKNSIFSIEAAKERRAEIIVIRRK